MTQIRKYIFITSVSLLFVLLFLCSTLRNSPFPPKFPAVCPCFAMFSDVSHWIIGIGTAIVALLRRLFFLMGTMMMSALCSRCSQQQQQQQQRHHDCHSLGHSFGVNVVVVFVLHFVFASLVAQFCCICCCCCCCCFFSADI